MDKLPEDEHVWVEPDDICWDCKKIGSCPLIRLLTEEAVVLPDPITLHSCDMYEKRPALRVIQGNKDTPYPSLEKPGEGNVKGD